MSGWQLEKAWEEKQKAKKKEQEEQMERFMNGVGESENGNGASALSSADDGLPFACFLSRKAFQDPVVTTCGHYFSQSDLQDYFSKQDGDMRCPICKKNTHGVMNQPTKLIAKKRKLLGRKATWEEFFEARGGIGTSNDGDDE